MFTKFDRGLLSQPLAAAFFYGRLRFKFLITVKKLLNFVKKIIPESTISQIAKIFIVIRQGSQQVLK